MTEPKPSDQPIVFPPPKTGQTGPQQPSIGRIVHYCSRGSMDGVFAPEPRAAIITEVHSAGSFNVMDVEEVGMPAVSLAVLNPSGLFFDRLVPFNETYKQGHWSWPRRV